MSEATTKQESKKRKVETCEEDFPNEGMSALSSLNGFKLIKVLSRNSQSKSLTLHAQAEDTEVDAVIKLDKTPFEEDQILDVLSKETELTNTFQNDVYGQYNGLLPHNINSVQAMVVFPATEKHIKKYQSHETYLCSESPQDYNEITLPWINGMDQFSLKWVYNILEHKAESDRIVFEDPDPLNGFILLPDLKWNGKNIEELYLSAIVHRHDLKSLRDLTAEHLPVLKNILDSGSTAVNLKYGVPKNKLRIYIHYQPSFYHLHAHFTLAQGATPGSSVERAHLLQDIIDNIENVDSEYYKKRTLTFGVMEGGSLYKLFSEAGKI